MGHIYLILSISNHPINNFWTSFFTLKHTLSQLINIIIEISFFQSSSCLGPLNSSLEMNPSLSWSSFSKTFWRRSLCCPLFLSTSSLLKALFNSCKINSETYKSKIKKKTFSQKKKKIGELINYTKNIFVLTLHKALFWNIYFRSYHCNFIFKITFNIVYMYIYFND